MGVIPFQGSFPKLHESVFLAPHTWIIGDVHLGEASSVFFGSVLRGDVNRIRVGSRTNIQEHSLLHTSHGLGDCIVGDDVTIGHRAIIHGCRIESRCIIGMGSTILDGAHIGEDSIVGANSLVTMNKIFSPRSMIMGSPAKVVRQLTEDEVRGIVDSAESYVRTAKEYQEFFLTR